MPAGSVWRPLLQAPQPPLPPSRVASLVQVSGLFPGLLRPALALSHPQAPSRRLSSRDHWSQSLASTPQGLSPSILHPQDPWVHRAASATLCAIPYPLPELRLQPSPLRASGTSVSRVLGLQLFGSLDLLPQVPPLPPLHASTAPGLSPSSTLALPFEALGSPVLQPPAGPQVLSPWALCLRLVSPLHSSPSLSTPHLIALALPLHPSSGPTLTFHLSMPLQPSEPSTPHPEEANGDPSVLRVLCSPRPPPFSPGGGCRDKWGQGQTGRKPSALGGAEARPWGEGAGEWAWAAPPWPAPPWLQPQNFVWRSGASL